MTHETPHQYCFHTAQPKKLDSAFQGKLLISFDSEQTSWQILPYLSLSSIQKKDNQLFPDSLLLKDSVSLQLDQNSLARTF